MKVAVLSHTYVEPENRKKLAALVGEGVAVSAFVPATWREGALRRAWRTGPDTERGVRIVPLDVLRLARTPAAAWWALDTLARELSEGCCDLLHVEEEPWSLAAVRAVRLARRARVPVTLFTWQNITTHPAWPLRAMGRRTLRRIQGWVAGNRAAAELLRKVDPHRPLLVAPQLGIDPPSAIERKQPGTPLRVAYIGRLVPEKGVDVLVRAAADVGVAVTLTVIGDGAERQRLEQLARTLGLKERARFTGSVPHGEVARHWATIDVLVLPSRATRRWEEQFGHILIEAMAAGVPAVGSDTGAIPEVIGDAGIVVARDSVSALAAALAELSRNHERWHRLSAAALKRAPRFTHQRIARELVGFWKQLLADRHTG